MATVQTTLNELRVERARYRAHLETLVPLNHADPDELDRILAAIRAVTAAIARLHEQDTDR